MQFTSAFAVAALASTAAAWYPSSNSSSVTVDYVTDVVTSYTTYCPEATTLTYNSVTYTITEVCRRSEGVGSRCDKLQYRSADSRLKLEYTANKFIGYHFDRHQLPLHHHQAGDHLKRSVLQHLVPFNCSKAVLYSKFTNFQIVPPPPPPQCTTTPPPLAPLAPPRSRPLLPQPHPP
jgi:hypothetical protein